MRTPQPPQSSLVSPEPQTAELTGLGTDSLAAQVAALKQLPPGQSQATLLRIGRHQGNRHVQRLVTAMSNGQEVRTPEEQASSLQSQVGQAGSGSPEADEVDAGKAVKQTGASRAAASAAPFGSNGSGAGSLRMTPIFEMANTAIEEKKQAREQGSAAFQEKVEQQQEKNQQLKEQHDEEKKAAGSPKVVKQVGGSLSPNGAGSKLGVGTVGAAKQTSQQVEKTAQEGQQAAQATAQTASQAMGQATHQTGQLRVEAQQAAKVTKKGAIEQARAAAEQAQSAAGQSEGRQEPQEGQPASQLVRKARVAGRQPGSAAKKTPALTGKLRQTAQDNEPEQEGTREKGTTEEGAVHDQKEKAVDTGAAAEREAQVPDIPMPELRPGFLQEAITSSLSALQEQPPEGVSDLIMRTPDTGFVQLLSVDPLEWARGVLNSLRGEASGKSQAIQQAQTAKQSQLNQFSSGKLGSLKSQSAAWPVTINKAGQTAQTGMQSKVTSSNQQVESAAAAQSAKAIDASSAKEAQLAEQVTLKGNLLNDHCGVFDQKATAKFQSAEQGVMIEGKALQEKTVLKGQLEQQAWKVHEKSSVGKMSGLSKEADQLFKALQAKAAIEGPSSRGEIESLWSNFVEQKDEDVKEIESKGEELAGKKGGEEEQGLIQSPLLQKWLADTPEEEVAEELEISGEAVQENAQATAEEMQMAAEDTKAEFGNVKESLQVGVQESVQAASQGLKATAKTTKEAVKQTGKTTLNNAKNTGKTVISSVRNTTNSMKQAMQNVAQTAVSGVRSKGGSIMQFFGSLVGSIVSGVRSVGQSVVQGFKNSVRSVFDTVRSTVDSIKSGVKEVVATVRESVNGVVDSLIEGARAVWDSAKTLVRNTINRIVSIAQRIGQLIRSAIQHAITFVRQQITRIINRIKAAARALAERIKALVQRIRDGIKALWAELKSRWAALKEKIKAIWEKLKGLARTIVYKVCDAKPEKNVEPNEKARVEERRKVGDKNWTFNPEDVVKENYKGMDTPELGNAMKDLAPFINRGASRDKMTDAEKAKLDAVIKRLARARGMDPGEAQKQYEKAIKLRSEALAIAKKEGKEQDYELPPENMLYSEFWGSKEQMAFGNIVGDNLGLDPAFGSMLSPTGGLVGPGANALHLKNSAIGYHGIAHDAAGYLSNYHKIGPGYEYRDQPSWDPTAPFETSDPLAGQVSGIHWWSEYLKGGKDEGKLGFMNPELTNFDVAGVNIGIRLEVGMNKGSIKEIFTSPLDPASYADLDLFARLRCQHSKAGTR
ncbi:MAG: hypothetical protein PVJ75_07360 [Chloroflexota bacterium]